MLKRINIRELFRKVIDIVTFKDLPIRKKFILFSVGTLFWFVVIAAIGIILLFEMNAKSKRMVEVIVPQERAANIVIRKLRGANISMHNIIIHNDRESISANYRRVKGTLTDSRSYLETLLTGGQITDHVRATGQIHKPFFVSPIKDESARKYIEDATDKIKEIEKLAEHIMDKKRAGGTGLKLEDEILQYDMLTLDAVSILNDYAISVGTEWTKFSNIIKTRLAISIFLMFSIFLIVTVLSVVFGALISRSISRSIKALNEQIKVISSGEVSFTKRLDINSKDEVGMLSDEFNKLMDTIEYVTSFKKVIEEDEGIEDIYSRLGRVFIEDLGLDNCVIYEVSNSKNSMKIVYPPEAEGVELHCRRDIYLNSELCRAKRTGHLVTSANYPNICKYYTEGADNIHYCIPIIIGGNVGGVVQFVCGKRGSCDLVNIERKISRAKQYIIEAQPVIEAKRLMMILKESSVKDMLTGLYNRRFLEESYEGICAGIVRRNTTLGLMMCDLDFFKQINDVYGHDIGDEVLKGVAKVLRSSVRGSDLVIRFGGEEFLVLLIDTRQGDAIGVAEKIRLKIEEMKIRVAGGFIQKTISIGISEFPSDTQNFWECVKYADIALYNAKETGRNKVVRFSPEMWVEEKY